MSLFEFIRFATKAGVVLQDPAAVDWAVWFHDVIYDPRSDSNEAASATLAGEMLTAAGLPAEKVAKVSVPAITCVQLWCHACCMVCSCYFVRKLAFLGSAQLLICP